MKMQDSLFKIYKNFNMDQQKIQPIMGPSEHSLGPRVTAQVTHPQSQLFVDGCLLVIVTTEEVHSFTLHCLASRMTTNELQVPYYSESCVPLFIAAQFIVPIL